MNNITKYLRFDEDFLCGRSMLRQAPSAPQSFNPGEP
jgi:hypothetical protein